MKRIVAISLAVVLVVLFIVIMIHSRSNTLEGKIEWREDKPAICLYSESGPAEVAYKVYVSGQLTNVSKDKLEVPSVVIRHYNSAGEKLGEEAVDRSWSPEFYPGAMRWSVIHYYAEATAWYDVLVTDSQGKEYACALAIGCVRGEVTDDLEGKIRWTEWHPFSCVYRQDVAPENPYPYEVIFGGQMTNTGLENVDVASVIFRFYNEIGERLSFYDMLAEEMRDERTFHAHAGWHWPVLLTPGEEGGGANLHQSFAEEVVRYDVFVTDSQGREYACLRTAWDGGEVNGERLAIEDTIRGYVETYNARDYAQCLTYFTDYGDPNDALGALAFFRDLSGELGFQEIREVAIANQTATVTVVFTIGGEEGIDQMQLKEVDGQWKIIW